MGSFIDQTASLDPTENSRSSFVILSLYYVNLMPERKVVKERSAAGAAKERMTHQYL